MWIKKFAHSLPIWAKIDRCYIGSLAILRFRDLFGMVSSRDPNSKDFCDLQQQDKMITLNHLEPRKKPSYFP